jgi:hypothetical protein
MQFRTEIAPQKARFGIAHGDGLLLCGSCFVTHIGERLRACKFGLELNPFGIVYNPISIAEGLARLHAGDKDIPPEELFEHGGLWHSWLHHGAFSHPDKSVAQRNMSERYQQAADFLKRSKRLLLTLGTADVFEHIESGRMVANNHKVPTAAFHSRRLSVAEVTDAFLPVLQDLHRAAPDLRVVLTVSPVRHLRNGLVENQRSKAVLLLACEALCRTLDFVDYFPAYELVLDDLRDYRFYAEDLVHPSDMAVAYVWEHFSQVFFDEKTRLLNTEIARIAAASRHRPFHADTAAHRAFQQKQLAAIAALERAHPGLDFHAEKAVFTRS